MWPAFGEAMERGDKAWAKKTIIKALKISIITTISITIPIIIFIEPIFLSLLGELFIPDAALLLGFFAFCIFANYGGIISTFLNNKNTLNKQLPILGLTCIFTLFIKIYFAGIFGVSGVIWGTVLGYSIFFVYPTYILAKKELSQ